MFTIREYVKVSSLEEAYELNQKKANVVFGGGVWLRLGKKNIQTAIAIPLKKSKKRKINIFLRGNCFSNTLLLTYSSSKAPV